MFTLWASSSSNKKRSVKWDELGAQSKKKKMKWLGVGIFFFFSATTSPPTALVWLGKQGTQDPTDGGHTKTQYLLGRRSSSEAAIFLLPGDSEREPGRRVVVRRSSFTPTFFFAQPVYPLVCLQTTSSSQHQSAQKNILMLP